MDKYIGEMLDSRYEILEVIGVGGMAVVYKALCHRLNRFVAVKILKDEFARDAEFRRRFHAESQAVAMLSHPNIVAVYDVSRSTEVEYIVMELIEGITLKQYIQRRGTLAWREALHFTTQIVKALGHAHSRGIIHRDIKPHNIMLLRDGSIKVADFGIARLASLQNTLTQDTLGSVHYISPEQARGSHIDARSDLYSVGVVMYEMLTSRVPFEGESAVAVAIQHINSQPKPPRALNPDIPEALEAITMKAMSANLARRYASADDMLRDLEEFRKDPSIAFHYAQGAGDEATRVLSPEARARIEAEAADQNPYAAVAGHEEDEEAEDFRRRRKNSAVTVITGVAAVLLFVFGVTFLVFQILGRESGDPIPDVVVPSLVNEVYAEVIAPANADKYGDVDIQKDDQDEYSDEYAEGVIMKQDLEAGSTVKQGATITVTVSLGSRPMKLPEFANKDYRSVQEELTRLNLTLGSIQWEFSDLVADQVIRTIPPADSDIKEGDTVTLVVSRGTQVSMNQMPNLVGTQADDVERTLARYNLAAGQRTNVDSDRPKGEIIWQSVEVGTEVEDGTRIDYKVSLGPVDTPSPSPSPSPSPTPPPSPSPSPSQAPSTVTKGYRINLPEREGTGTLTITLNGAVYLTESVEFSAGSVERSVTGMPGDEVAIYIDGDLLGTRTLS